jgi:hypothetical protein
MIGNRKVKIGLARVTEPHSMPYTSHQEESNPTNGSLDPLFIHHERRQQITDFILKFLKTPPVNTLQNKMVDAPSWDHKLVFNETSHEGSTFVFNSNSIDSKNVVVVERPLPGNFCLCAVLMDLEVIDVVKYRRSKTGKVLEQEKLLRLNNLIEKCLRGNTYSEMLEDFQMPRSYLEE